MSPIEAIMWRVGQHAALRMTVGLLLILDRRPSPDQLRERLSAASRALPRLRWRPDDPTGVRVRPMWIDDGRVDVDAHLTTAMLPSPGDRRQLLDLVSLLEVRPFDPARPPWDVTLIDGVDGERAALYLRAHHALTDGPGGVALVRGLFDPVEPTATAPSEEDREPSSDDLLRAGDAPPTGALTAAVDTATSEPTASRRRPGTISVTVDLTRAAGMARQTAVTAAGVAATASAIEPVPTLVSAVQRGFDTVSSLSRQAVVVGGPLSPLASSGSIANRFEVISIAEARSIARALGGSRNDLLVAATAAALGDYHRRLGIYAPELRMAMPVARRREGATGGNWFAPSRVVVPTANEHAGPFYGVVNERVARARGEPSMPLARTAAAAVSLLPSRVLVSAIQGQARSIDFFVTSFSGRSGTDRSVCDATITEIYPFGPRVGCLLNVAALGIGDRLDVGLTIDPAGITEPELLLQCLEGAIAGFAAERSAKPQRRARAGNG